MSWGGKRINAGRPLVPDKRVKIWPTITAESLGVLSQIAFDEGSSLGEAIDKVTMKFDKKKKRK